MSRHSKSNTDGAVFTYHERQQMQHGRLRMRLPDAAHKPWYACPLSLRRPHNPVLTPAGVLYDREAILSHLLSQKRAHRQAEANEETKRAATAEKADREAERRETSFASRFTQQQNDLISTTFSRNDNGTMSKCAKRCAQSNVGNDDKNTSESVEKKKKLNALNFWVPGAAVTSRPPDRTPDLLPPAKRPRGRNKTHCPVTGTPLRARDLITLTPTENPLLTRKNNINTTNAHFDGDTNGDGERHDNNGNRTGDNKDNCDSRNRSDSDGSDRSDDEGGDNVADEIDNALERVTTDEGDGDKAQKKKQLLSSGTSKPVVHPYICPVCRSVMSNAAKPVALRSGTVLCAACADTFVRMEQRDPVTDQPVDPSVDMIVIHNAGTAFTGSTPHNPVSKEATLYRPSAT